MDLVTKTIAPVRRLAHTLFRSQVRLRVRGGLRVELDDPSAGPRPPTAAELQAARHRKEYHQILSDLKALLDDDLDTRGSVRYLVFVEQALIADGPRALCSIPLDVLERALEQFEDLVTNWSPVGLASLRSRMSVAVQDRRVSEEELDPFLPPPLPRAPR